MKKILSCLSLALCVILGTVFLAACGSTTKWLRPEFKFEGGGYTVEFVTNIEKDFEFPIKGLKLDHSKYSENIVEYRWAIYNAERELVGWIEAGNGYDNNKNGNLKYGYSPSTNNGVYGFTNSLIYLTLKGTDLTIFDRIEVTSDLCSVEIATQIDKNPMHGTEAYSTYDMETGISTPLAGSENFVYCIYSLKLESVDPDTANTINITFTLKGE